MKLQERKKKGAGKVPRQGCGGRRAAVVETDRTCPLNDAFQQNFCAMHR